MILRADMRCNLPVLNNIKMYGKPSFGKIPRLKSDAIRLSDTVKNVQIEDISGRKKDAVIIMSNTENRDIFYNEKKLSLISEGCPVGYAVIRNSSEREHALYLKSLYTEEDADRHFRGTGSELLKQAARESIKRGYKGRISAYAYHTNASPLVFYCKKNFTAEDSNVKSYHLHNAAIHYAALKNIPLNDVLTNIYRQGPVHLDEKGAKALLADRQLCLERKFETVLQKNQNGIISNAHFIQSNNKNEYFLLVTHDSALKNKAALAVSLHQKSNTAWNKHLEIQDIFEYESCRIEDLKFAAEAFKKIEQEKGYQKTKVSAHINDRSLEILKKAGLSFLMI